MSNLGRTLIWVGIGLIGLGVLLTWLPRLPWLGRLPGDLSYEGERVRIYAPLASSLLISAVLSLVFYLFRR